MFLEEHKLFSESYSRTTKNISKSKCGLVILFTTYFKWSIAVALNKPFTCFERNILHLIHYQQHDISKSTLLRDSDWAERILGNYLLRTQAAKTTTKKIFERPDGNVASISSLKMVYFGLFLSSYINTYSSKGIITLIY